MLRKSNTQYLENSVLFLPLFSCIHVNEVECHQTSLVVNRFSFVGLFSNLETFMSIEIGK